MRRYSKSGGARGVSGRSGSPAGGRNPTGGTARNRPPASGRNRRYGSVWTAPQPQPGTPYRAEPEVRRWPHPVEEAAASAGPGPEPALHYIRCALSYQNQLLADIKALLEQQAAEGSPEPETGGPPKL